jgi:phage/plasmid-like protein (TIGR03299 family)
MAHEIELMANGQYATFSVKQTPWHGLGTVVQVAPSAADAIRLAGLDWPVELQRLQMADGRPVEANAVIRATDGKILGHHVGKDWTPLQNADAFRWFDPFVQSGECSFETAGSLRGGSRVWILAELNRKPAEIADGDTVRKFLLLSNSHDGSLAVRVGFTPIRVVCANTLAMAHGNGGSRLIRLKHTAGLGAALADIRDTVNTANEAFEATAAQYRRLAASKVVNRADLRRYVVRVLELPEGPQGELSAKASNILAAVMENAYAGRGNSNPAVAGTWWTAYNAVTEYLGYTRGRSQDSRVNALWFGDGATINSRALEIALAMAV